MTPRVLFLLSIISRSLAAQSKHSASTFIPAAASRLTSASNSLGSYFFIDTKTKSSLRSFTSSSAAAAAISSSTNLNMTNLLNIHWFRQTDLRLHDNPALCQTIALSCGKTGTAKKLPVGASSSGSTSSSIITPSGILPVFVFDTTRIYGSNVRSNLGCLKCGPRRAQFVLEAVADLRSNLEKRGSGLLVAVGKPEVVLADIAKSAILLRSGNHDGGLTINVICQEEVCSEELSVDKAVRAELAKIMSKRNKFHFETVWGSTMYDPNTLPYDGDVLGIPDTFTPFRNQVEKHCKIGSPLDEPKDAELKMPPDARAIVNDSASCRAWLTAMPTLADLGYSSEDIDSATYVDSRSAMPKNYQGGETFALKRVKDYIWDKDLLKNYFDTRNGMIGSEYSTKFAPWLALGNVSPRYIARECRRYEESRVQNKSTYWVVFELLWRDYCKFFAKKYGDRIFYPNGILGASAHANKRKWGMNPKQIQAWKDGMTGYPLIDANMRELAATGFMSNRGRQNVCSFLTIDMNMDWRYGGDYFEETLLDYDVHSNYVNWLAGAGMTGGRLNRFNIVKQSKDYDFGGDYVRLWCPELKNVPDKYVHEPWKMSEALMEECGVKIGPGRDYPSPIINPDIMPKIMNSGREGAGAGGGRGQSRSSGKQGGGRGGFHERKKKDKGSRPGTYAFDSKYV